MILYKFIWNRHFLAAKAPERIKREIMNKPIKLGGLGMLSIEALDESLKIKALGRTLVTNHPFMGIVRDLVCLEKYFEPELRISIESCTKFALELLKKDRDKLWQDPKLNSNRALIGEIRETNLKSLVSPRGQYSLQYFNLWARGARQVKDLSLLDLRSIERHIREDKLPKLKEAVTLNVARVPQTCRSIIRQGKFALIEKCTSKEIRESRQDSEPIKNFRIGLNLTTAESLSWLLKISKITSTKHKNVILRVAHGDVYTMEKLYRFGLEASNICPRCDEVETLEHKFIDCPYTDRLWLYANEACDRIDLDSNDADDIKKIFGANKGSKLASLTLRCEVLNRILTLSKTQDYLIHPKIVIQQCIRSVASKEKKADLKSELYSLIEQP